MQARGGYLLTYVVFVFKAFLVVSCSKDNSMFQDPYQMSSDRDHESSLQRLSFERCGLPVTSKQHTQQICQDIQTATKRLQSRHKKLSAMVLHKGGMLEKDFKFPEESLMGLLIVLYPFERWELKKTQGLELRLL